MNTIIICTPHERHNDLIAAVKKALPGYNIIRLSRKEDLTYPRLLKINPSWIFFPHWSWVIPQEIFSRYECVIFHMTDVPYGRGGSPLQNLIVRGHKETKLSALKCINKLDAGPVYAKLPLSLEGSAEKILRRASILIKDLIILIVKENPKPKNQSGIVVEFNRRQSNDGDIANLNDLEKVFDYIRMLDATGYPPAFMMSDHFYFEFKDAVMVDGFVEASVRIRKRNE